MYMDWIAIEYIIHVILTTIIEIREENYSNLKSRKQVLLEIISIISLNIFTWGNFCRCVYAIQKIYIYILEYLFVFWQSHAN
jgi:hypothetical protein